MKIRLLLAGLALALASAGPVPADDGVKIGFITKFPVPFFATMEDAAKSYAAANPGVEIIFGQGTSATDIEGQIALIESMVTQGRAGDRPDAGRSDGGARTRQGHRGGREDRPDGQQHPRLERADGAGDHRTTTMPARSPART